MKQNGVYSFLARTRALILYISIWIFDFGPEKLPRPPGLFYVVQRNGPFPSSKKRGEVQNLSFDDEFYLLEN